MTPETRRTALVLTGGGARAAYQVGVLKAVAELLPGPAAIPFGIVCGASAGAINATALACYAARFGEGVRRLEAVWSRLTSDQIYQTDLWGMTLNSLRWIATLFRPKTLPPSRRALMDNAPLRRLLARLLRLDRIRTALAKGHLHALSVTCSGYNSGESVSFFEGHPDIAAWTRSRRMGARSRIRLDHLMASSAIPLLFPAVKIHREYFGDGSMRFLAPISPALHLGADRVMIIGVADGDPKRTSVGRRNYPTIAEIGGHVLDSVFIDSLSSDLERLQRINRTLGRMPEAVRTGMQMELKPIETLVISPSQDLAALSGKHAHALPPVVRFFFHRIGITRRTGSAILSYLLFESGYTRELIALGYADALRQKDEILAFFAPAPSAPERLAPGHP